MMRSAAHVNVLDENIAGNRSLEDDRLRKPIQKPAIKDGFGFAPKTRSQAAPKAPDANDEQPCLAREADEVHADGIKFQVQMPTIDLVSELREICGEQEVLKKLLKSETKSALDRWDYKGKCQDLEKMNQDFKTGVETAYQWRKDIGVTVQKIQDDVNDQLEGARQKLEACIQKKDSDMAALRDAVRQEQQAVKATALSAERALHDQVAEERRAMEVECQSSKDLANAQVAEANKRVEDLRDQSKREMDSLRQKALQDQTSAKSVHDTEVNELQMQHSQEKHGLELQLRSLKDESKRQLEAKDATIDATRKQCQNELDVLKQKAQQDLNEAKAKADQDVSALRSQFSQEQATAKTATETKIQELRTQHAQEKHTLELELQSVRDECKRQLDLRDQKLESAGKQSETDMAALKQKVAQDQIDEKAKNDQVTNAMHRQFAQEKHVLELELENVKDEGSRQLEAALVKTETLRKQGENDIEAFREEALREKDAAKAANEKEIAALKRQSAQEKHEQDLMLQSQKAEAVRELDAANRKSEAKLQKERDAAKKELEDANKKLEAERKKAEEEVAAMKQKASQQQEALRKKTESDVAAVTQKASEEKEALKKQADSEVAAVKQNALKEKEEAKAAIDSEMNELRRLLEEKTQELEDYFERSRAVKEENERVTEDLNVANTATKNFIRETAMQHLQEKQTWELELQSVRDERQRQLDLKDQELESARKQHETEMAALKRENEQELRKMCEDVARSKQEAKEASQKERSDLHGETEKRIQQAQLESERVVEAERKAREKAESLAKEKSKLEIEFHDQQMQAEEIIAAKNRREEEDLQTIHTHQRQLAQVTLDLESSRQELAKTREELSATRAKLDGKSEQLASVSQAKTDLNIEFNSYKETYNTSNEAQTQSIAELKVMVGGLTNEVATQKKENALKTSGLEQNQCEITELKKRLQEGENRRRDMHNALQELKGNIRVFCRVRPSVQQGDSVIQVNEAAQSIRLNHGTEAPYDFSFDTLFGTGSGQADVFDEVSGLVQSALDGYKVCIFAYGQTGSGKTYTMQGGREPSSWGLVPRALKQILDTSGEMRSKGWTWSLTASFLEVYNEGIYDLLHKDEKGVEPVHTIIHDEEWGLLVTNMTSEVVGSMNEITELMNIAARKRAVGGTDMNEKSSRSHAVFALYMKGVNEELQTELRGALHLVDLAGSERLDKSGATGGRLKETQNINKSLSSLADVFLAKAEGRTHVPFRNSKLTYLMEPCLSGSGKTLMFVNVGPEEDHAHESLCSLRFAKQVSQCHTGKPKKSARMAGASSNPPSGAATPPLRAGTPRGRAAPSSSSSRPTTPFGF